MRQVICLPCFWTVTSNPASDRNRKRTWVCFSPLGTFPKTSSRSVHVLFSYHGNKQTDRQTNAGKNIIPRFRGDNQYVNLVQGNTTSWIATTQNASSKDITRGKVLSWEYRSPQKRNSRPSSTNHCPQAVLLLIYYRKTIKGQGRLPEVCLQYKNPRFTAFLDSNLHTG